MKNLLDYINLFGIQIDDSAPFIVMLASYYLIVSTLALLNVLNIIMYVLSIYILSHERFLKKIPVEYVYVHKLIIYYKNIRVGYIIFEVLLLLFLLFIMIGLSYGLVNFYLQNK